MQIPLGEQKGWSTRSTPSCLWTSYVLCLLAKSTTFPGCDVQLL